MIVTSPPYNLGIRYSTYRDTLAPREYLEWITEAKTDATRTKRIDQTLAWLSEGKPRNWKYEKRA